MKVNFKLNNTLATVEADADERLATILRRDFHLLSVKKNCMLGVCGSCMVLLNQTPIPSCMVPIFSVEDKKIITLEYFETTPEYRTIVHAFKQQEIHLCGFCSAGIIFTAYHLLQKKRPLSYEQIHDAYVGTLCNCTNIENISAALKKLSTEKSRRGRI